MRKALLDAVPEGCCVKCYYAKGKPCRCRCGGAFHGLGVNRELPKITNKKENLRSGVKKEIQKMFRR